MAVVFEMTEVLYLMMPLTANMTSLKIALMVQSRSLSVL